MPIPLAVAAPAALAGAMYLNAKTALGVDLKLISNIAGTVIASQMRERKDRINLFYVLEDYARNKTLADATLLIFEGRRWTYKQVYETALKYGTWLKITFSIKPQDIVAMDFQNSDKFIFIWLGLWSIGARPAFINYNLTGKALAHCVRVSTTQIVLVDPNVRDNVTDEVRGELPDVKFTVFTPELELEAMAISAVREPDSARSVPRLQDMSNLIYTSGTTGLPKPAVVSWNKNIAGGLTVGKWMNLKKSDVFYTCMPLYHSSASILGFISSLQAGCTFSLGRKFSTKKFWQDVRETDATVIQYVGETCRYLLAAPPQISPSGENLDRKNKVRIAFGNGLRPDIWNKFKDRFGIESIAEFYAATEANGMGLNFSRNEFSRGAIGRSGSLLGLIFGSAAVVELDWESELPHRDKDGFCKRSVTGEPGELLYVLDAADIGKKYQGYFNNEKASNSKILRDVFKKGDAYFRTGDVVRLDGEGRLYFHDRIGDTFRWKSENVSTNEVAECLAGHPGVQEANVYGVELPHHDGRAGCVALVLNSDASHTTIPSLANHASKQLPRFAVPLFVRKTQSMETTGTNKQQKHVLRTQGIEPGNVGGDELFWLKGGEYVRFAERDWEELKGGRVKL